jgi:hypothetical protein
MDDLLMKKGRLQSREEDKFKREEQTKSAISQDLACHHNMTYARPTFILPAAKIEIGMDLT